MVVKSMAGLRPNRKPLQETPVPQPTATCIAAHRLPRMSLSYKASSSKPIALTINNRDSGENDINKENGPKESKSIKMDPGLSNEIRGGRETPSQSFVVSFGNESAAKEKKAKKGNSLQDAFKKFRMTRQNEIKQSQMMKERELAAMCDRNKMWQLRMKFVESAKCYFGVPYAKKYHQPGTPEYDAPLFLDCCALVRQVLRDLKEEFGFNIGPWNQAYQYDSLPVTIEEEEEMKPGDLVFISGIYYNKKSKKQRHNMVHVEIWAGEGTQTIGARWQKGKVQVFDSYKFEAKSYHSMQYHFKSIDTWLQGICKSYCPEHAWTATTYEPGRKSIFSVQQQESEEDEGAGDTEDDLIESDAEESLIAASHRLKEKSDEGQEGKMDVKVVNSELGDGEEGRVNFKGETEDSRKESRDSSVRKVSENQKGKNGENRCWEHIETSPVRTTPRMENDVVEMEEKCWHSIESISEQSMSEKESEVENRLNAKNRAKDEEIGEKEASTLNAQVREVVKDILQSLTIHTQHNTSNAYRDYKTIHHDQNDNGWQPEIASHCQWSSHCSGDDTRVSLESLDVHDNMSGGMGAFEGVIAHREHLRISAVPGENGFEGSKLDELPNDGEKQNMFCGRVCPNEDGNTLYACSESWLDGKESPMTTCQCCTDTTDLEANSDECDNTSLDDWPCYEVIENTSKDSVFWKTKTADKTLEAVDCHKEQQDEPSHCYGLNSIQSNHDNSFQPTKQVLCSVNQISWSPKVNDLTSGYHGNDRISGEARDGDDGKPNNGASKGSTNGKAGRKSPDKKGSQRSQLGKGKNPGEPREPSGTGGGNGGGSGSISRPSTIKDLGPAFYIGGGNGVSLIEDPLMAKGWHRIHDKNSDSFKLKWVELKTHINYTSFRPGDQLVNRIPNTHLLATKTGLFTTLREYERLMERTSKAKSSKVLKYRDFFAESFILDLRTDRETFFQTFKEGEIWICKPNGMNQGKGIYLVRDITELRRKYEAQENATHTRKPRPVLRASRLIQRYIPNPLLLDGKKFDVRTYMLIACTNPFVVLFHTGYLRLACDDYDADSTDLHRHLTNQYQQKKHPSYQDVKEETVWSMERFNDYVNEIAKEKGLSKDWVMGYFHKQMHKIMLHCFNAVKNKLDSKLGFFDLLGFDFLIDTDMKVWLIEINVNPALHTNCEVLRNMLPAMIEETLDIVLEVFEKSKRNRPIMPLTSQRQFNLLHNGSSSSGSNESFRPTKSTSPPRRSPTRAVRARSTSPAKKKPTSTRPVSVRQNVTKVSVKSSKEKNAGASQEHSKDSS